jgi:hypothetical protein
MPSDAAHRPAAGFIVLLCLIPPNLMLRTRLKPKPQAGPIIDFSIYNDLPYSLFVTGAYPTRVGPGVTDDAPGAALIMCSLYLIYYYNTGFALSRNAALPAGLDLVIINGVSVLGRLIVRAMAPHSRSRLTSRTQPNYLADRVGPINVLIPLIAVCSLLLFLWTYADTQAGQGVYCAAFGFASGAFVSAIPACIASLTTDMRTIGCVGDGPPLLLRAAC